MGINSSKNGISDSISFRPDKISQSPSKEIKAIYIDSLFFPHSGLYLVGTEYVENYSQNGQKLVCFYQSPSKILTSSFSLSNCRGYALIALGCQEKFVYLLNASNLQILHKVEISLKLENLDLPKYNVKCSEESYFSQFCIDNVLTCFDNSFLVGLSTGFTKQYSLESFEEVKVFNPIPFEYPPKENEKVNVSIENAFISGIESIAYSSAYEIVLVNHKNSFVNCMNRTFTLQDTPICMYKRNGEPLKKFKVQGEILSSRVLENRSLYLCLTSWESQLYIFNFVKCTFFRVSLDFNRDPKRPLHFTGIALHEFDMNLRYRAINKVFPDCESSQETINGDIIFGIENSGSVLISKLTYETEDKKLDWVPLKSINFNEMENKNFKEAIKKNVLSREIACLEFDKSQDKLYFSDTKMEVVILSNILKKTFAEQGPKTPETNETNPQ